MKTHITISALLLSCALLPNNAFAADLGGDCCADLEERVAELEATTVRKGNRKVSLEVSGHVNTGVLYWDDGVEENVYVVDNAQDRSRFRFRGKAKIDGDWQAGFLIELGARAARSDRVTADIDDTNDGIDLRHANWFIESKTYGRLTVGQGSQATDGITQINLAGINHVSRSQVFDWNGNFDIRQGSGTSDVRWRDLAIRENPGEGNRNNLVRYDTPTFAGFTASAAWGEDDVWDVALRYATEFQGFKLAGGIGYGVLTEADGGGTLCIDFDGAECQQFSVNVSVLHTASGLFANFVYGQIEDENRIAAASANFTAARVEDQDEFYWVQAGLQQKWTTLGKSTIYGEYYRGEFGTPTRLNDDGLVRGRQVGGLDISSSEVDMWGFGFNQTIDAAAMDLFIGYRNYEADVTLEDGSTAAGLQDFQAVLAGGIIKF
ncbi:MAG: porin [Hyphomicrobiaceae bacterium]|nr:porin [Hyphomicrobiaceae bacterium]